MNDFDDPLRCSSCGRKMSILVDTPICLSCNPIQVADLTWQKNYIEENKK